MPASSVASSQATRGAAFVDDANSYDNAKAWYALFVIELQLLVAGMDVAIVTLLVRPIEAALRINDVTFATITTTSLAIGMTVAYYPAGLLTDTFRRRDVMVLGSVAWTIASLIAARTDSASLLLVARFLAGVGIGILGPSMFSFVCDAFPPKRRAFALSVYISGISVGVGVGLAICGWLVDVTERAGLRNVLGIALSPWQQCFLAVAISGILSLALILTMYEAPRHGKALSSRPNMGAVVREFGTYLRRNARLWTFMLSGFALGTSSYYAVVAWGPTLGARHFSSAGFSAIALLGTCKAVGALLGAIGAGLLAQYGINRGLHRMVPYTLAGIAALTGVIAVCFSYMPSWVLAALGMGGISAAYQGLCVTMDVGIQDTVPNESRGQLVSIAGSSALIPQLIGATLLPFIATSLFARSGDLKPSFAIVGAVTSLLATIAYMLTGAVYEKAKVLMEGGHAATDPIFTSSYKG